MVLITRPQSQAKKLLELCKVNNIVSYLFPVIKINKLTPKMPDKFDVIIFISVNAVKHGVCFLQNIPRSSYLLLTVGSATAKELLKYGLYADYYPKYNPSSKSLLALQEVQKLNNLKFLIVRGVGGMETLKNHLQKNNIVNYLEVYKRDVNNISAQHKIVLNKFFLSNKRVIIATSVEIIKALLKIVKDDRVKDCKLIVISSRIKQYAINCGFFNVVISNSDEQSIIKEILND